MEPIRCYWNAKAYARNPDVIGIIGSYNSGCSREEIPVANQAANGPLAMISQASTYAGLTRLVPGRQYPGDLQHLYPTGKRNFVRTPAGMPPDRHGNGPVRKAERRQTALPVLERRQHYYAAYAAEVGRAAQSLGIRIAGAAPFDKEAHNYDRFARRIAATRADGVVLSAYPPHHPAHCCVISAPASVAE